MKLALNPFKNKKPGKKAEQEQKIEFELDEKIERMLEQYRPLEISGTIFGYNEKEELELGSLEYEILKPSQIDTLLQKMIQETPKEKFENRLTGRFLSKIIQKSFEEGYNNFTLTTKQTEISSLGSYFPKVRGKNPMQITIKGNAGHFLGFISKNCEYDVQGSVGIHCGDYSTDCTFKTPNIETYGQILYSVKELGLKGNKVEYTGNQ